MGRPRSAHQFHQSRCDRDLHGEQELEGPSGEHMRAMVSASGTGRFGTTEGIADAAAFLLSSEASFITGSDLLVDGGVVAATAR